MILLMRESDLYIEYDVISSAIKIGGEAKEAVLVLAWFWDILRLWNDTPRASMMK